MSLENKYMSVEQFLRRISGLEKEILLVDHNYVKAWNAHPDSHRTKPARLLFMKGLHRYPFRSDACNIDEEIDIESCTDTLTSPFDNPKQTTVLADCEKTLRSLHPFKEREFDEEELDLSQFTSRQKSFYNVVLNVIDKDKLTKLCASGNPNEPVKRRLSLDKCARELRQIFGLMFWDSSMLHWLHSTLLSTLDIFTLSSYIEILQSLRSKAPTMVDRMLQSCAGTPAGDAVIQVMKKTWDPVLPILNQNKPKKLPGDPIILICPSAPNQNAINSHSARLRFWHNTMSSMCKVMNIPIYSEDGKSPSTMEGYLEMMIACIRTKVTELKNHYPNRPLILLGWTIGALIACHIALQEPIDGVICVGFPLTGINGSRGDLNDPLLENKVPTLFIVGQNARMCTTDDMEDFRARMRAETGLVIVGGSDDLLRMCPQKMKLENVTQTIVDRCLLDEIGEFLMSVVIKMPSTSAMSAALVPVACATIQEEDEATEEAEETPKPEEDGKRKRRKPREYSPELSPVRKRPKHHISRQPASSIKVRLSPTSSETSSSGSCIYEKPPVTKSVKKKQDKRSGRPASGSWRRRTPSKQQQQQQPSKQTNAESSPKKAPPVEALPALPVKPKEDPIPFSKAILPKKNAPVDIEKAFGSDSSFLPRPLTPPEPEDTVSAEETESAMAELEAMASGALSDNTDRGEIASTDRAFLPLSSAEVKPVKTPERNTFAESAVEVEPPRVDPVVAASDSRVLSPAKPVQASASGMMPVVKTLGGISLLANPSTSKSTIITIPSGAAASLLASNPNLKSGHMFHILAKGKNPVAVGSAAKDASEPQSNLSLLCDVAGMTEPMKKSESSSATLVKLTSSEKTTFQNIKCLKVVKAVAPSAPMRVETTEEMVEKQLAIQALNKSIGLDSQSNPVKEPGYSICYTKADGSVVSRSIARPNFTGFVPNPRMVTASSRGGRGKVRGLLNTRFRFNPA